jgi:8-oxo-dGTP diphosphatase
MITCTFEKAMPAGRQGHKASLRHVVVHAIVEMDGKLLLEKRAGDILETGKWALPGGFLDRDETAQQGALRELKEETGWEGEIISAFRINTKPDRPHEDRQNIAVEFLVKAMNKVSNPDSETSGVEWIPIEALPPLADFAFDHGESIGLYLTYRKTPFPIPIVV